MLEKVLPAIGAVAVPVLGLLLRASRRNRLKQRIDEYSDSQSVWLTIHGL